MTKQTTTAKILGVTSDTDVCEHCGKTNLKKVVTIQHEDGRIINYGTTCAGKVFGKSFQGSTETMVKVAELFQKWNGKFTAKQIADGLWNKVGCSTEVHDGNVRVWIGGGWVAL